MHEKKSGSYGIILCIFNSHLFSLSGYPLTLGLRDLLSKVPFASSVRFMVL